jgi:hypothetical protein
VAYFGWAKKLTPMKKRVGVSLLVDGLVMGALTLLSSTFYSLTAMFSFMLFVPTGLLAIWMLAAYIGPIISVWALHNALLTEAKEKKDGGLIGIIRRELDGITSLLLYVSFIYGFCFVGLMFVYPALTDPWWLVITALALLLVAAILVHTKTHKTAIGIIAFAMLGLVIAHATFPNITSGFLKDWRIFDENKEGDRERARNAPQFYPPPHSAGEYFSSCHAYVRTGS